ncbi:MAG: hypothetical protein IIA73_09605 [Proteobacteria bacterium]|nr:hypothetical protein [Pseudomonadota bacterium]
MREVPPDFQVVPQASPQYAIYPHQCHLPPKLRAFIDVLAERFAGRCDWSAGR